VSQRNDYQHRIALTWHSPTELRRKLGAALSMVWAAPQQLLFWYRPLRALRGVGMDKEPALLVKVAIEYVVQF